MRQIKFRGLNANGQFVYGLPSADAPNSTQYYKEYSCRICWLPEGGGYTNQPIKNGTLGQFTGLKDVNGVEIYEGDILTGGVSGSVKPVVVGWGRIDKWTGMSDGYKTSAVGFIFEQYYFTLKDCKVIGNIHQHPELLP